jgi:hypothetical protein
MSEVLFISVNLTSPFLIEKGVNMCNSRVDPRIQLWGNGERERIPRGEAKPRSGRYAGCGESP